jgi:hypothetical protein
MSKNSLSRLEIEIYSATRKFANIKNKEKDKRIFFAKMEDRINNGTNSTIFTLECLGNVKENGFARATYSVDPYSEEDYSIKIEGQSFYDPIKNKREAHKIVGEYKEFLIREIYGLKESIKEPLFNSNNTPNNYNS